MSLAKIPNSEMGLKKPHREVTQGLVEGWRHLISFIIFDIELFLSKEMEEQKLSIL